MKKDILAIGYAGAKGVSYIIKDKWDILNKYYNKIYLNKLIEEYNVLDIDIYENFGKYINSFINIRNENVFYVGEGGVLSTLYLISVKNKCGIKIFQKKVPIKQSSIEVCELFRLNPYRLYSDMYILLVDNANIIKTEYDSLLLEASRFVDKYCRDLDKIKELEGYKEYVNKKEFIERTDKYNFYLEFLNNKVFIEVIGCTNINNMNKVIVDKTEIEYINKPIKDEIYKLGIMLNVNK